MHQACSGNYNYSQQECRKHSGCKQQVAKVVTAIAAAWWQPQGQTFLIKEATIDWHSLHDSSGNMVKIIMQQKGGDSKAPAAEA